MNPIAKKICAITGQLFIAVCLALSPVQAASDQFDGKFISGRGDVEYLRLLNTARRMFAPDPEYQNLPMLYCTNWNGFVEGPTWDAWWIQNSYGTTYAALPLLQEPYLTFLQNAQDLWFDQMGDGQRAGTNHPPFNWVAPDGCLCDAAQPGRIIYRQGDGRTDIHDWAMEFTAAGVLLQSELLLISHDPVAVAKYLPKLERSANFIETRRDTNDLFLAGPAGNLLAPSYAGWKKPDGTYGRAYLTGLSITHIAALDRLIELEKFSGRKEKAAHYAQLRDRAKSALNLLITDEGYFIRSLDPDGVKHGVFGAAQHGYFEAPPNHDAIAFGVVDDFAAARIFRKIESIPELRPHQFILPNYPSYDDMYEKPEGLWGYGTWVNGGHWSTCEARMMLAYYRLGHFEDAKKSMQQLLHFADQFRLDNPLTQSGNAVYQPNVPINLCYDSFGPAAAFLRGLFGCQYLADRLILTPHLPPGLTRLEQRFPIRFGSKSIYLTANGSGPVMQVLLNGHRWKGHDEKSIDLPYQKLSLSNHLEIVLDTGASESSSPPATRPTAAIPSQMQNEWNKLHHFTHELARVGLGDSYAAAHARIALDAISVLDECHQLAAAGKLKTLPAASQTAADQSYVDTAVRLYQGLDQSLRSDATSVEQNRQKMFQIWKALETK